MKRLLIFFILMGISLSVYGTDYKKSSKPMACAPVVEVFEDLVSEQIKEMPMWIGTDREVRYTILSNVKRDTWTLVQFNDKVACVLAMGTNGELLGKGQKN